MACHYSFATNESGLDHLQYSLLNVGNNSNALLAVNQKWFNTGSTVLPLLSQQHAELGWYHYVYWCASFSHTSLLHPSRPRLPTRP